MSRSTVVIAALLLLSSSTAFAQQNERDAFLTSVAVTSTTTVVGGAILTMTLPGGKADLEQYLRQNAVAVRHDVTRGAGATLDDLAWAMGVADDRRAAFGRSVRAQRAKLLALADPRELTAERAAEFADLLRAAAAG